MDDTYNALASLDPSKAMGIDEIPPGVLKFTVDALYKPIHHVFSLCISISPIFLLNGVVIKLSLFQNLLTSPVFPTIVSFHYCAVLLKFLKGLYLIK